MRFAIPVISVVCSDWRQPRYTQSPPLLASQSQSRDQHLKIGDQRIIKDQLIRRDELLAKDQMIRRDELIAKDQLITRDELIAKDQLIRRDELIAEDQLIDK